MAVVPWILTAAGIGVIIIGLVIARLTAGPGSGYIDHRMSDKEIARQLKNAEGNPLGGWIMVFGCVIVLAGLGWRIVRLIVAWASR